MEQIGNQNFCLEDFFQLAHAPTLWRYLSSLQLIFYHVEW